MHDLDVVVGPDLLERPAQRGSAFPRVIGSHLSDDGVHGVVSAASVDAQPADPARLDPVRKLARRARVLDEVAGPVTLDRATLRGPRRWFEARLARAHQQDGPEPTPG